MKTRQAMPSPAVRCLIVVASTLLVGLHVFGGWPTWTLHLNVYRLDLDDNGGGYVVHVRKATLNVSAPAALGLNRSPSLHNE